MSILSGIRSTTAYDARERLCILDNWPPRARLESSGNGWTQDLIVFRLS